MALYEFSSEQIDFLKRINKTVHGRELKELLNCLKTDLDRSSTIAKDSDYGAQVEGRKLAVELIDNILSGMAKKSMNKADVDNELDEDDADYL